MGGRSWLPLAPLVLDRDGYGLLVQKRVVALLESGQSLVIGLGALHHFAIVRALRSLCSDANGRLAFFLDINLYIASDLAFSSLSSLLPGVEFAYRYLEFESELEKWDRDFLAPIGPEFEPPLFQSLGCVLKHHIERGTCPSPCDKDWSSILADRDRRYRVIVEDCVTTLFRIGRTAGRGP